MNRLFCLALCLMSAAITVHAGSDERARWQNEARNAKIVRDNWGIAHVYGKSDADAVFGSLYAQAEDDFARIEHNFEADEPVYDFLVDKLNDAERLGALGTAVGALERDFGGWRVPWGEVNRFQRLTDDIVQPFDDAKPSLPVGFAPSRWGALASFDSSKPRSTRKIYGSVGNSFVAAVEFGTPVRAKAIMSG